MDSKTLSRRPSSALQRIPYKLATRYNMQQGLAIRNTYKPKHYTTLLGALVLEGEVAWRALNHFPVRVLTTRTHKTLTQLLATSGTGERLPRWPSSNWQPCEHIALHGCSQQVSAWATISRKKTAGEVCPAVCKGWLKHDPG